MAKKMYYNEAETAQKLGIPVADLGKLVRDDKLRVFQDGSRKMYKVDEVDKLAGDTGGGEFDAEIALQPAEQSSLGAITLGDSDDTIASSKEDTVITADGISIFDEEDLEIEAADPMAKTQIAPSLDDQVALEGVGSGSGLLDLTRESDDTSLGAEVLDHIDDVEGAVGSGISSEGAIEEIATVQAEEPVQVIEVPVGAVEEMDASSGLFGGFLIGAMIVMVVISAVIFSVMLGQSPAYLEELRKNMVLVLISAVLVTVMAGVLGMFIGKSMGARTR
ncbi:MAG: hypothetical protein BWX88_01613 [Planctomycetes bacterium ADurb.Bin126]|nr:MAG: hypothetical protein BWX88_01613 [Planctomycetes bacterium ADurb.Bin126]HOD83320.1 hypothetical protein [Phycisphaerae bacterium]HQL73523.1 hypothetical protein [Phycisphaerae bacterium]